MNGSLKVSVKIEDQSKVLRSHDRFRVIIPVHMKATEFEDDMYKRYQCFQEMIGLTPVRLNGI